MIRFVSQQSEYDFFLSFDPAFKQCPEDEEGARDYDAKLTAARKTSDYSALLIEGQTPTKFVLGQIDPATFRALMDRCALAPGSPGWIGTIVAQSILFRLAIREIPSLSGQFAGRIEHKPDPAFFGWKMAPAELAAQMDATHPRIVSEIGTYAYHRAQEVDPLS